MPQEYPLRVVRCFSFPDGRLYSRQRLLQVGPQIGNILDADA